MDSIAKVSQVNCYPVKSLGSIVLSEAHVEARGLRHDRRWMIVDPEGRFLTQRELPRMALIIPALNEVYLTLHAPGMSPLQISLTPAVVNEDVEVRVWRSVCRARLVGTEADEWLSSFLDSPCRLVYMPDETRRAINPDFTAGEGIVSFADGYPLMLLSQASLDNLNGIMDTPAPMDRFRPNIVITGTDAFAEDNWKCVKIGDVMFHVVKPCDRCVMTTIDQQTAQRDGPEPIRTLSTYRIRDGKVLFGQYLVAETDGRIAVGDTVTVISAAP